MSVLAFAEPETDESSMLPGSGFGDSIRRLVERTRGWAAGLSFAPLALDRCLEPDLAVTSLAGDSSNIAEYLSSDGQNTQPRDVRDVLLRTSVVEVLRPGLIEQLGGDSPPVRSPSSRVRTFRRGAPGGAGLLPLQRALPGTAVRRAGPLVGVSLDASSAPGFHLVQPSRDARRTTDLSSLWRPGLRPAIERVSSARRSPARWRPRGHHAGAA